MCRNIENWYKSLHILFWTILFSFLLKFNISVLSSIDRKLEKLETRFDNVDARLDSLSKEITDFKVGQAELRKGGRVK